MKNEFSKLWEFLKRSHERLFIAYKHFQIWEAMQEIRDPFQIGKKQAEKNVKTMNNFINFFGPTMDAHRKIFAIELVKFFDPNPDSLSIVKIINFAKANLKKLTLETFKESNSQRLNIDELSKNYDGIKETDLNKCRELLFTNGLNLDEKRFTKGSLIGKLKKFRNQDLAHDQIKKKKVSLSAEEIEKLFKLAENILNLLSQKLNRNSWWHFSSEDSTKSQTKLIFEYLQRFEPYRLKEIKKNRKRKLHNYYTRRKPSRL
ncbi:hypothetical protein HZA38_06125 [Candidatus Peregrinibacteria bacterium]|nr:hypothetical protein [Candidatus Peregrinibacteria bacterium]